MSWDDYWNGDCEMVRYYRQAAKLKRDQKNTELWLQGLYVYEAMLDASPVLRTSLDGKRHTPLPYPSQPYALDDREREERKKAEEVTKAVTFRARMNAWAEKVNLKKKSEEVISSE